MPLHEVRVTPRGDDPLGRDVLAEIKRTFSAVAVEDVKTSKVYRVESDKLKPAQAKLLAEKLFCDPVTEQAVADQAVKFPARHIREVAYLPGVMNPESESIIRGARYLGVDLAAADSSLEYAFIGQLSTKEADAITERLLVNHTVQQIVTKKPSTLLFRGQPASVKVVPLRNAQPDELMELSRDKLFLDLNEMTVIQKYFKQLKRDPTDCELEIIAARWSEHCGHKTFNAKLIVDGQEKAPLFKRIKQAARQHFGDLVVSAFNDNSGAMRFYDGWAICGKVETHNSPSAVEPYGGAMTGSGGVFRDIMGTGQGAQTIISTDMFCVAEPDTEPGTLPAGTLRPDYLLRRVVQGVRDYGNRMGIPTGNGSVHFHPDFRAKPSVIVGAYGILPEDRAQKGVPRVGDMVVIIGGATGRDGLHGATFSSGEMTDRTATVNASAVQIGNAIEEKRTFDALLEARDQGLIRAITDCGAAGFSSAIGEIGEDTGVQVDISKAPLKYSGLAPWEIWLSESQERMVAAISPDHIEAFMAICRQYNVMATVLGEFDGSHRLTVNFGPQTVAELDYEFLREGLPQRVMKAAWQAPQTKQQLPERPATEKIWVERLNSVLAHGNVCSKEPIVRQYDHGVQGGSVIPPFSGVAQDGPNDAFVLRPLLNKPYAFVQSHGMHPLLNRYDPYEGSWWAVAEAMANYVAAGGDPAESVLINNFIWPYPDEEAMGSLDKSVDAIVDAMHKLKRPVISGKDSLSSTYRGKDGLVIKIPPVLCISVFGRLPDAEAAMTTDIKRAGSVLVLVGRPQGGLGGSAYYDVCGGNSDKLPLVDTESLLPVLQTMHQAIAGGMILACHDISEGGLVTAVSEMCFGGGCGADITLSAEMDAETALFGETAGCFVVEVENKSVADQLFTGVPYQIIGSTIAKPSLNVYQAGRATNKLFSVTIDSLKKAWQAPMKGLFH